MLQLGQLYHANGFVKEARACYLLLEDRPEIGPKVTYYLAMIALDENDLREGVRLLARCVQEQPAYVPARILLAKAHRKSGNAREARAAFLSVLERDPENPDALIAIAREDLQAGRDQAAAASLERLTATHPEFVEGLSLYAEVLERAGHRHAALEMRRRSEEHKDAPPSDPWRDEMLINCFDLQRLSMLFEDYQKAARVDEALAWLRRIEKVDPEYWLVCQIRGLSFAQEGRFEDAEREYRRAILSGGDPGKLYSAIIGLQIEMNRLSEAAESSRIALTAAPGSAEVRVAVAQLREREGDEQQAINLLREALELESRSTIANRELGLIYWREGRHEDALPLLKIVLDTAPDDVAIRGMLGQYWLEEDEIPMALAVLDEANRVEPENQGIRGLLALAWLRTGNDKAKSGAMLDAIEAFEHSIAMGPELPDAYMNKAMIEIRLERPSAAVATLSKLAGVQPDNPMAFLALGDARFASGDRDGALVEWTKAERLLSPTGDSRLRLAVEQRLRSGKP